MSPKASTVARLSQCLPRAAPSRRNQMFPQGHRSIRSSGATDSLGAAGARGRTIAPSSAAANAASVAAESTAHLAHAVPTSSAVIVYAFNPADQLVKGLAAAERKANRPSTGGSGTGGLGPGGDADDHRKCVLVRAAGSGDGNDERGGDGFGARNARQRSEQAAGAGGGRGDGGGYGGSGGGFGSALAAGLSRPVLAEDMGETHLWVMDAHGRRHLAAAFVSLQRATVFITLSASAQFPPFRVENRSSTETLAYRQVGPVNIE